MKAQERHHLKQNEFVETTARVAATLSAHRERIVVVGSIALALLVIVGGYFWWTKRSADEAGAMLGKAMAIQQAQIAPAPTVPGATQLPGTYPTEQARQTAALQAFQQVSLAFPSSSAGLAAKYHAAALLLDAERLAEAEPAFRDVVASAGRSIYGPMAKLGLASALSGQAKHDEAIKILTDLSGDRDGALPVDAVLMELARACVKGGKIPDAKAAYKRIVDSFPDSTLVAEARQRLAALN
jgi:predicted negative regulator of RcsB-dependent stress response